MDKVVTVIPARNEAERICAVVDEAKNYCDLVLVIDDGSTDGTSQIVNCDDKVKVVRHSMNLGKGAALKTGCDLALQNNAGIIVIMDADGQHKASDIQRFVREIREKRTDIVFGARKLNEQMPFIMVMGNRFLSWLISFFFGVHLSDTQGGFRAFRSEIYPKIKWQSSGYAVETEMIKNVGRNHLTFCEIPIDTIYKDKYKGTTIIDGIRIFINIIFWKFL